MKSLFKIFFYTYACTPLLGLAQNLVNIEGKINADTLTRGVIVLHYTDHDISLRDTAYIENNTYHFEYPIQDKAVSVVMFLKSDLESKGMLGSASFWIEAGSTKIAHERFHQFTLTGSGTTTQQEQDEFEKAVWGHSQTERNQQKITFIQQHPDSWLSYVFLKELFGSKVCEGEQAERLYASLSPAIQAYESVRLLDERITGRQKLKVGKMAENFVLPDTLGRSVSLSSFRGKYLFVDFWASWCHPCRNENPHVIKAYNRFKNKNFDVLGVSLDSGPLGKQSWMKAINEDRVGMWTQVNDLQGHKGSVALQYGIVSIPVNMLLDRKGTIIAINLRGDELENKLAELLK